MRRSEQQGYPGQYLARESVIHNLPASARLGLSLVLALGGLCASSIALTMLLAVFCVALYAAARLGARALAQDCILVVWQLPVVLAAYFVLHGRQGLPMALTVSMRLALFSLPGLWLQRTTSAADLRDVLARVLPGRVAFLLSMTLRFVPLLARDAGEIYWLQRLRGARVGPRDLANPINWSEACHCLAVPMFIRALQLSDQVSIAARQRGVGKFDA